jgi:8-amino-7-oxononanoate synthase
MALEIIRLEPERRQRLHQNINFVKSKLNNLNILPSEAAILCLPVANPGQALELSQKLLEKGIFAPAIRPPTVPTSRLRFTAMATHSLAHLEVLVQSIGESFPT